MQSIGSHCTELKKKYEDCFNVWYSEKFIKGVSSGEDPCKELFREYQVCIIDALRKKNLVGPLKEHGHDVEAMVSQATKQSQNGTTINNTSK